ncbi:MAG: hypothetical protein ACYC54_15345 [Sedimentisphaerales bacterium]
MDEKLTNGKNPLKYLWDIISVPMSVLGLLSLSDSLVTLNINIQHIIDSYQSIVHPVFKFLFGWLWFDIPTWIFDYMTLGILFTSCQRKAFGLVDNLKIFRIVFGRGNIVHNSNLWRFILGIALGISWSIVFWPFLIMGTIHNIRMTDSDGIITSLTKGDKPIRIRYNFRDNDILVLRYICTAIIVSILILILNYTYLIKK